MQFDIIHLHFLAKNIPAHLIKCYLLIVHWKTSWTDTVANELFRRFCDPVQLIIFIRFDSKQHRYCIRCKFRNFLKNHYIKSETELICGLQKVSFCPIGKMGSCWRWCYTTCTCCLSEEEKNAIVIHNEIKRILADQKKRERKEIKVLLLGEIFFPINIYFKTQLWTLKKSSKELRSL